MDISYTLESSLELRDVIRPPLARQARVELYLNPGDQVTALLKVSQAHII